MIRPPFTKIPEPALLADLRRVGARCAGRLSMKVYERDGRFKAYTIVTRFGSWREACFQAGIQPATVQDRDLAIDSYDTREEVDAARRRRLAQRKPRGCLGCPRTFLSDGPHNRICPTCSRRIEHLDCMAGMDED
jgi:hypothetical protein